MRLILARHGQTPANVDRVLDTLVPGPGLTDLGREQARALGQELAGGADGAVTALYHSRARRAGETAQVVGAALDLVPTGVDGVHEAQAGDLEGRNDDEAIEIFRTTFDDWQAGRLDVALPGGESGRELLDRFLATVAGIRSVHPADDTVMLVSHGAAMRLAARALVGGVGVPAPDENHVANAGRIVLDEHAGGAPGWVLVAWRHEVPGGLPTTRDVTG